MYYRVPANTANVLTKLTSGRPPQFGLYEQSDTEEYFLFIQKITDAPFGCKHTKGRDNSLY